MRWVRISTQRSDAFSAQHCTRHLHAVIASIGNIYNVTSDRQASREAKVRSSRSLVPNRRDEFTVALQHLHPTIVAVANEQPILRKSNPGGSIELTWSGSPGAEGRDEFTALPQHNNAVVAQIGLVKL